MILAIWSLLRGLFLLIKDMRILVEYALFTVQREDVVIALLLDWVSLIFIRVVLGISSLIIVYREGYMGEDLRKPRFVYLICLFVLSIILLIVRPNLISILLG